MPALLDEQIQDLVILCREYILGVTIELKRRELLVSDPANVARNLELAALFTHAQLQPPHQSLALRSAMTEARKVNNYAMAASFARRLLELAPAPQVAQKVSPRPPPPPLPRPRLSQCTNTSVAGATNHLAG